WNRTRHQPSKPKKATALQNDGNENMKERFLDILRAAAPYRELWLRRLGVTRPWRQVQVLGEAPRQRRGARVARLRRRGR
ncbi:unnamed protein product, partial [Urochloa humidicola]